MLINLPGTFDDYIFIGFKSTIYNCNHQYITGKYVHFTVIATTIWSVVALL